MKGVMEKDPGLTVMQNHQCISCNCLRSLCLCIFYDNLKMEVGRIHKGKEEQEILVLSFSYTKW